MKRTITAMITLALAALLTIAPIVSQAASTESLSVVPDVTFSQALILAGVAYPNLTLFSLTLEDENGAQVYQAEFYSPADLSIVEIAIDGTTGQVLPTSADEDNQNGNDGEDANEQDDRNENETENENIGNNEAENTNEDVTQFQNVGFTVSQAYDLVMTAVPGAFVTGIELENENNALVFGITYIDAAGLMQQMKIDAVTGAFLSEDMQSDIG